MTTQSTADGREADRAGLRPVGRLPIGHAFRWSLAGLVVGAVVGGVAFHAPALWKKYERARRKATLAAKVQKAEQSAAASLHRVPKVPFVDITRQAGVGFHLENGAYGDKLMPEMTCGGCAFFDYDNDGDQDLLLVNFRRWPSDPRPPAPPARSALYRNNGRGAFTDVSAGSGLDVCCAGQGVAVGDYDNDGWVDVFIAAVGHDHLFHNDRGKGFSDVTDAAGVAGEPDSWGNSSGFFDYDNDGDLDLFVGNYVDWSVELDRRQQCRHKNGLRKYCGPDRFVGTYPSLYRNEGGGRFRDVSEISGVQVQDATGRPAAKTLAVTFCDVDADGFLDVLVANDRVRNFLFLNRRDGTFDEVGERAGMAYGDDGRARSGMGVDAAHFRNDERLGVTVANFVNEPTSLFVSDGRSAFFEDCNEAAGLGPLSMATVKWGTFFFDCDLDGRLDVLVANGHVYDEASTVQEDQTFEQPQYLFYNCGLDSSSEFVLVPEEHCGADFRRPMVGRGAAYADIDGDGDLDVLLTATAGPPRLLRNDQALGNHWLRVKLVGRRCNRDAIGASIEAHLGGVVQRRYVCPARSYVSQVELPVTFGLGGATRVDRLVIGWPDGSRQEIAGVAADQMLFIEQP